MSDTIIRIISSVIFIMGIYIIATITETDIEQCFLAIILLFLIKMDWEK